MRGSGAEVVTPLVTRPCIYSSAKEYAPPLLVPAYAHDRAGMTALTPSTAVFLRIGGCPPGWPEAPPPLDGAAQAVSNARTVAARKTGRQPLAVRGITSRPRWGNHIPMAT